MIDDDFSPDRQQLWLLGILLLRTNNFPGDPFVSETELFKRLYGGDIEANRPAWLTELADYGLIRIELGNAENKAAPSDSAKMCLTPGGVYYCISRAALVAENAHGITVDFPEAIVDATWALSSYFAPGEDQIAPGADRYIRFDDNAKTYETALRALEEVSKALASDNEIGAREPIARDEKLSELRIIRQLLEKREGWSSKVTVIGWGVLGYLMSHFADRPVAYLAERAWDAIKSVVGLR